MFASWAVSSGAPTGWDWDPGSHFTGPPPHVDIQEPGPTALLHNQPAAAAGQVSGLGGLMLMPHVGAAPPPSYLYINNNPTDVSAASTSCNNSPGVVIPAAAVADGTAQRKRPRPGDGGASGLLNSIRSTTTTVGRPAAIPHQPFVGQVDHHDQQLGFAVFLRQHLFDVDALVTAHMDKVRSDALESRRRLVARLAAAADAAVARRVRQKQDHIVQIAQANAALEDRVRWLAAQARAWRDIARVNEESAAALRRDLDAALLCRHQLQEIEQERQVPAAVPAPHQHAQESCCGNSVDDNDQRLGSLPEDDVSVTARRWCRDCGVHQAVAVLLPCRHLCLCSDCAHRAQACPLCSRAKQSAVLINLSLPCSASSSPPSI